MKWSASWGYSASVGRHFPTLAVLHCPNGESWGVGIRRRRVETHRILHCSVGSTDTIIHCEAERQLWRERQEERCCSDTSKTDFFDPSVRESYWRRIEISELLKDLEGK